MTQKPHSESTESIQVPRYEPFPLNAIPRLCRNYVQEVADAVGCDSAYVALPMLTSAGALAGNSRRLKVKSTWHALPTLWTIVVGESGTGKTPAMTEAIRPIRQLQQQSLHQFQTETNVYDQAAQEYEKELANFRQRSATNSQPPDKPKHPTLKRLLVQDTTIEALAPILLNNPKGVLLHRDELAAWFSSFNKYNGKKGADEADWMQAFDGESITIDRKGAGSVPLHVPSGVVSICGGIQPAILRNFLTAENRASGLAARFLIAQPPRQAPLWSEAEVAETTRNTIRHIFRKLDGLKMAKDSNGNYASKIVTMAPEAKKEWVSYYNKHQAEQGNLEGDIAAAWSKLIAYVPRLTLLLHLLEHPENRDDESPENKVTVNSVHSAITLTQWFKGEAQRLYQQLDASRQTNHLLARHDWLLRKHPDGVTVRDYQLGHRSLPTADQAEQELNQLAKAKLGTWDSSDRRKRIFRPIPA